MDITAFLPCRRGSQRVPNKNIRPFADHQYGLIQIKLDQLLATPKINQIVLSTNDQAILDFAQSLANPRLHVHQRDDLLGSSETSTDELVAHALDLIPEGHILWTHVTSPFFSSAHYCQVLDAYEQSLEDGFDSLMTVSVIHGFLWNSESPINYDRNVEKWPRTQTIAPVYEINSAVFLNSSDNYRTLHDRIGKHPFLYKTDKLIGFDIDWPEDFLLGECIAKTGVASL